MSKTPIKVLVRSRPTANLPKNIQIDENTGQISINIPKNTDNGIINNQQQTWGFQFDKVLTNASQEVIYNLAASDILNSALQGYSGCIMCYGQTGAGKTFTMTGARNDYKYRGIIPRILSSLFQQINNRYEHNIKVSISYIELYNQILSDLLIGDAEKAQNLTIQQDNKGYVIVKGQTLKQCQNQQQALGVLFEGETNRTIAEHQLNKSSSRSHCIYTIHLQIRSKVQSSEKVIMSKINLVDLAGSQRTKKTGSEGKMLVEAQFINKSLSFLQQLVVALSEKKRDHIPYRQNKLTYLLKDSIGGNSKTYMVANIWPEYNHMEQTISTLRFASRMMKLSNEVSIEVNLDPTLLLKKYQKQVKQLKQQLAMHDTLSNRGRVTYEAYSPEQQYQQQKIARDYLQGKSDDIQVESLRQVKELFTQFRNIYRNLKKDIANNVIAPQNPENQENKKGKEINKSTLGGVGIQQNKFGFGLGKAQKNSKPNQITSNLVNIPKEQFKEEEVQKLKSQRNEKSDKKIVNVNKNEAYQQFKNSLGLQINNSIIKNNQQLKQKKQDIKQKTEELQTMKNRIDEVNAKLKVKQTNKTQQERTQGVIDQEEFQLLKQKKQLKKNYKLGIEKIKNTKNILIQIDQNISSLKNQLLQKFQQWFLKRYGINLSDVQNPMINNRNDEEPQQTIIDKQDVDYDALAYINARKRNIEIQKAKKLKN